LFRIWQSRTSEFRDPIVRSLERRVPVRPSPRARITPTSGNKRQRANQTNIDPEPLDKEIAYTGMVVLDIICGLSPPE